MQFSCPTLFNFVKTYILARNTKQRLLLYYLYKSKGRHQKKNCRFGENCTIGGEGVRKIIEFSSFTNDEKHGRGGTVLTCLVLNAPEKKWIFYRNTYIV